MEAVAILYLSLGRCSQEQDQWPQFCQEQETGLASKSQVKIGSINNWTWWSYRSFSNWMILWKCGRFCMQFLQLLLTKAVTVFILCQLAWCILWPLNSLSFCDPGVPEQADCVPGPAWGCCAWPSSHSHLEQLRHCLGVHHLALLNLLFSFTCYLCPGL